MSGNQPLAYQAAQALIRGTDTEFADHMHVDDDPGHGRTERWTLRTDTAIGYRRTNGDTNIARATRGANRRPT